MNNKIYDAKALLATMSKRKSQYEETKKQMEALKKEFNEIVKMSEFQGKGAEAIKGFYQAQVDVADAWDSFFDMQITFLSEISGTMEDVDLHGETVVTVPFLEQNVANGITSSEKMVNAQHDDLKKIFERIQDIIVLEAFSKETFENHIGEAEKEMKETVNQVDLLDTRLQTEYAITEQHEANISTLFSALLQATAQGGEVSPINFDSKAYEKSEIYQLQDELKQQSLDYINYKEEQAEERKLIKEIEEKENRPWYKKVLDTGSTIVAEVTGYNDMRRAAEGVDPVTKEKLSEAERIAAGGMAIAGYIPVVGWVGRGVKAGHALYKTAKGVNAATHALQAYKTPKAFSILEKSEMGLYGLVAANGFGEYFTGKDMFGNELTEEQKQQGLMTGLMIGGTAGAARIIDKGVPNLPYSKEYVQQQIQKGQAILKDMGRATNRKLINLRETAVSNIQQAVSRIEGAVKKIGDIKIPIGMPREQLVLADGMMDDADVTRLKDFFQRADSGGSSSRVDDGRSDRALDSNESDIPPAFDQTEFASSYEARINQTPAETNLTVVFEGIRGESLCTLKPPPDPKLQKILNEAGINGIEYKNGVPDFSPVAKAQIEIDYMFGGKGSKGNAARGLNFEQANEGLASQLNNSPELAHQFGMESGRITAKDIEKYRVKNQLTWHELNDGVTMQLVPTEINAKFGHLGGVGEINAGAFEPGGFANK
ncbi:T7SS effector LXG polymorphic toxin [Metabacillus fastidiosus]|uniref:T7SS effector LXG polymorphic toxin n=1 Tax=Metabacillus fastidiosus TaxID=1458 RepID=UPI00082633EA|nr:T7SS effector LXG polymorphic toxin [Metabacillus fastidiosus]MED4461271.1 T7SS effector LXG polymorphic toxin [Metabacillus fastidiosus]